METEANLNLEMKVTITIPHKQGKEEVVRFESLEEARIFLDQLNSKVLEAQEKLKGITV